MVKDLIYISRNVEYFNISNFQFSFSKQRLTPCEQKEAIFIGYYLHTQS